MESTWDINAVTDSTCQIEYKIKMEFANVFYSAVTTQFFDFLVANINSEFEQRCAQLVLEGRYNNEIVTDQNKPLQV